MGAMSDVLAQAAIVRLDVFDRGARCSGASVAPGAPPPSLSKVAAAGQQLKLDVPAGHHVLLLSAFADAMGTVLVGSACTEADITASQPACFDLTLSDAPDGAVASADMSDVGGGDLAKPPCVASPDNCPVGKYCAGDGTCASGCKAASDCAATPVTPLCDVAAHRCVQCLAPSDCALGKQCSPSGSCVDGCVPAAPNCPTNDLCCGSLCIDVGSDLSNCGACGRACSSAHVDTPGCNSRLCAPSCAAGWADCNHPIAPNPDDGCETNIYDVNRCGACNAPACNLPNATAACPSGSCTIASCSANHYDCDGKASTGCECAGTGCCGTGCQTLHGDGFGHPFYDCIASGYTEQLARDAAAVFPLGGTVGTFLQTCSGSSVFCKRATNASNVAIGCGCWAYAGTAMGYAKQTSGECMCPSTGDSQWQ